MTNLKLASAPSLLLCAAALLVVPACDKGGSDGVGTSALISNGVDDDKDGETDEGDESQCGADDDDEEEDDDDGKDDDGEDDDEEEDGDDDSETDDDACKG
jgi:hypothetical protein